MVSLIRVARSMLRIAASIKNTVKCRFLHTKEKRPAEIKKDIVSVYGNIL